MKAHLHYRTGLIKDVYIYPPLPKNTLEDELSPQKQHCHCHSDDESFQMRGCGEKYGGLKYH